MESTRGKKWSFNSYSNSTPDRLLSAVQSAGHRPPCSLSTTTLVTRRRHEVTSILSAPARAQCPCGDVCRLPPCQQPCSPLKSTEAAYVCDRGACPHKEHSRDDSSAVVVVVKLYCFNPPRRHPLRRIANGVTRPPPRPPTMLSISAGKLPRRPSNNITTNASIVPRGNGSSSRSGTRYVIVLNWEPVKPRGPDPVRRSSVHRGGG